MTETFITAFTLWTNKDLASSPIERDNDHKNHQNEGKTENQISKLVPNIGTKEPPSWHFEPLIRNMLPESRMLLGIGNKTQDNFWDFMCERIEAILEELIEVQNVDVLCFITLKRSEESLDKSKEDFKLAADTRK